MISIAGLPKSSSMAEFWYVDLRLPNHLCVKEARTMKPTTPPPGPADASIRRAAPPVICYPADQLPAVDLPRLATAAKTLTKIDEVIVPVSYTHLTLPTTPYV